ncbi:MAG TPA: DUF2020 domain-containing protein [Pseudonocardiaceae bacterium]|nr:DUF2020 domain-containing protein [Pseudonocardiaceae bacterium]
MSIVAAPLAALGVLLAGCSSTTVGTASPVSTVTHKVTVPPTSVAVPPKLPPAKDALCPFLDSQEAANDNGQHVGSVRISTTADGQPHPVCYFYRPDGHLQLTVRVYVGQPAVAQALVNQAAPVTSSDPANQPPGWNGGSEALSDGSVYAIAKGGTAVVVISNQLQTIKGRLVATAVVQGLDGG